MYGVIAKIQTLPGQRDALIAILFEGTAVVDLSGANRIRYGRGIR